MASRSDFIKIFLQTYGAAKAKGDIKKVADETQRLNQNVKDSKKIYEDASASLDKWTASQGDANDVLKKQTDELGEAIRRNKKEQATRDQSTSSLKKNSKATEENTKSKKQWVATAEGEITVLRNTEALARDNEKHNQKRAREAEQLRKAEAKGQTDKIRMVRKLTGEARKSYESEIASIEKAIKSSGDYSKQTSGYQARANRVLRAGAKVRQDIDKNDQRNFVNELKRSKRREQEAIKEEKRLKKLLVMRRKAGGNTIKKLIPDFKIRPYTIGIMGLFAGILELVPLIGTALNAAAAGAMALINGLGQMSGVLGAIPAGILAGAEAIGILTLAFRGLGKAMTDQYAFAQMGPQTQQLIIALQKLKPVAKDVRNTVREDLFAGMSGEIMRIANVYLPFLNQSLGRTASRMNTAFRNFTGWSTSHEGKSTIKGIAGTNEQVIGNGIDAGQRLLQTFLLVANAAGPMLRMMSVDVVSLSDRINNFVANRQSGIANFFMRGYDMFKGALHTIGDYGAGVYNIIKQASPLTDHIATSIEKAGIAFRNWTSGADGKHGPGQIKAYFAQMQPALDAVAHLAGRVAKAIFNISRQPEFVQIVNRLTTEAVPKLEKLFTSMSGQFLNVFINLLNTLSDMADSGTLDAIAQASAGIAQLIQGVAGLISGIPTGVQAFALEMLVVLGITEQIWKYVGGIGKAFTTFRNVNGAIYAAQAGAAGGIPGIAPTTLGGAAAQRAVPITTVGGAVGRSGAIMPMIVPGAGSGKGGRLSMGDRVTNMRTRMAGGSGIATEAEAGAAGGSMLAGMGPLLAAIAAYIGIGAVAKRATDTTSGLNDTEALNALASGDLNKFMVNKNGKAIGLGLGTNASDASWRGALKGYASTNKGGFWGNKGYFDAEQGIAGLFGAKGRRQQLADATSSMDAPLATLAQSDPKAAQAQFDKIYQYAKNDLHMPMQDLLTLFPQYKEAIEKTLKPTDEANHNLDLLARRMAGVAQAANNNLSPAMQQIITWMDLAYQTYTGPNSFGSNATSAQIANGGAIRSGNRIGMAFAGGALSAGQSSIVGEFGPEATVDRSGRIGMVGLSGPELISARRSFGVIPASATSDPTKGDFGKAPGWARSAFLNASEGRLRSSVTPQASNGSGGNVTYAPHVVVQGSSASAADIESAVMRGIKKADQDRRERR